MGGEESAKEEVLRGNELFLENVFRSICRHSFRSCYDLSEVYLCVRRWGLAVEWKTIGTRKCCLVYASQQKPSQQNQEQKLQRDC